MNRQTKRLMAKQEKAKGGSGGPPSKGPPTGSRRQPPPSAGGKKKRTSPKQFLKEVRLELRKVQWPTRKELVAYTIVVFVSVVVLTSYVFGLDYLFSKAVLQVFGG